MSFQPTRRHLRVSGITGVNAADKFAQVNAASTLNVSNCIVDNAGKFLRWHSPHGG